MFVDYDGNFIKAALINFLKRTAAETLLLFLAQGHQKFEISCHKTLLDLDRYPQIHTRRAIDHRKRGEPKLAGQARSRHASVVLVVHQSPVGWIHLPSQSSRDAQCGHHVRHSFWDGLSWHCRSSNPADTPCAFRHLPFVRVGARVDQHTRMQRMRQQPCDQF